MDLMTRCPHCAHTFEVSLAQLKLRKGFVRCARCSHIFDGYEAVVPEEDTSVADKAAPAAAATPVAPVVRTSIPYPFQRSPQDAPSNEPAPVPRPEPATPPAEPVLPSVVRHRVPDSRLRDEPDSGDFTISLPTGASPLRPEPMFSVREREAGHGSARDHFVSGDAQYDDAPRDEDEALEETQDDPDEQTFYVEPRADIGRRTQTPAFLKEGQKSFSHRLMKLVWRVLALLAVVLALIMLVYVYRVQIANSAPVFRPMLENACAKLDCRVPYARQIDQIQITKSSLKAGAAATGDAAKPPQEPGTLILEVSLRNSHGRPQEWPVLVLDLTDFSGATVVRRELPPDVYLSSDMVRQPFAAASEVLVRLPVIPKNVSVNGYKLSKYFP